MKTFCTFSDFRRMHMEDDELFECLASMCPESLVLSGKSLRIRLEDTDPRLPEIKKVLELAGWPQKERPVRLPPYGPKGYLLTMSYVYEESDYEEFDYFGVGPKNTLPFFDTARTSEDGAETICIPIDGLVAFRGCDFLVPDSPCRGALIVTGRVKAALESEDLIGVGFAEVRLIDKAGNDVPWLDYEPEQWWELESPLELPPPCENVILSNPATRERLPQ